MSRAGYVLVGGRSSRMGRDKALLAYRGEALAASVARVVRQAAGSAVLVGDAGRYGALGYPVIADGEPGEGPLGGILTALEHSKAKWSVIVACDMPELSADFLVRLFETAELAGDDVLVPVGPSGRMEPLCAVYGSGAREGVGRAFAGGVRKVAAAFEGLRVGTLSVAELSPFQNVNTPEEWARYAGK